MRNGYKRWKSSKHFQKTKKKTNVLYKKKNDAESLKKAEAAKLPQSSLRGKKFKNFNLKPKNKRG